MSFGLQSDESLLLLTEERAMVSSLYERHYDVQAAVEWRFKEAKKTQSTALTLLRIERRVSIRSSLHLTEGKSQDTSSSWHVIGSRTCVDMLLYGVDLHLLVDPRSCLCVFRLKMNTASENTDDLRHAGYCEDAKT